MKMLGLLPYAIALGGLVARLAADPVSQPSVSEPARRPSARIAQTRPARGVAMRPATTRSADELPPEMDVPEIAAPPAPPLTAEESLKTIRVAPGYRVELAAADPLVEDPVCINFDADGRLWVVEMRGYMPDIDGTNENQPIGRVVCLEDTDGDGRMDKSTVFLDGLVLPRAATPYRDGVLVAAPPFAWFCRDTDGDGKCDERTVLASDYDSRGNPEHQANGLLPGLDNWIYNANYPGRFRLIDGKWVREAAAFRGQWGITQDDVGRLYYNYNEDQLRADLVPAQYLMRNPHFPTQTGINVKIADDQSVYPIRVTPGVNRGYQPRVLKDGKLVHFTSACAPHIYRGELLKELYGNAFVCEPAGNVVKRDVLEEKDGIIKATGAHDEADFFCSTDERFRPVFICTGPDGALYICDMYRGIIQHRAYETPYLRRQIRKRNLEQPRHMGRIYRVVPASYKDATTPADKRPHMLHAPPKDLIQYLSHPNGWWRDNAQQQIVARGDASVAPALAKLATAGESALGRLHALWALEGLGKIDARTIESALSDSDPRVRMAAMRLADPLVADPRSELVSTILKLANDPQQQVRLQFLFTASAIPTTQAEHAVAAMLTRDAQHPYVREAAFSGLAGRELEMLQRLMADPAWQDESPGRGPILGGLASCVIREGNPQRVSRMLDLTAAQSGTLQWRQTALVSGMTTVAGRRVRGPEPVQLAAEPELLASLRHSTDPKLVASGTALAKLLDWPGKPKEQQAKIVPLTPDQQASFERGSVVFGTLCAACHQFDGRGLAGKAPSLVGSEWLLGPKGRPIRVVLHGLRGPVTVNGETTNMEMPPLGILKDEQIADVLTYLRREWGHAASPVALAEVTQIRTQTASRSQPWTEPELKALNLGPTTYPSATEK